jgi:hypothetical protein
MKISCMCTFFKWVIWILKDFSYLLFKKSMVYLGTFIYLKAVLGWQKVSEKGQAQKPVDTKGSDKTEKDSDNILSSEILLAHIDGLL